MYCDDSPPPIYEVEGVVASFSEDLIVGRCAVVLSLSSEAFIFGRFDASEERIFGTCNRWDRSSEDGPPFLGYFRKMQIADGGSQEPILFVSCCAMKLGLGNLTHVRRDKGLP